MVIATTEHLFDIDATWAAMVGGNLVDLVFIDTLPLSIKTIWSFISHC